MRAGRKSELPGGHSAACHVRQQKAVKDARIGRRAGHCCWEHLIHSPFHRVCVASHGGQVVMGAATRTAVPRQQDYLRDGGDMCQRSEAQCGIAVPV